MNKRPSIVDIRVCHVYDPVTMATRNASGLNKIVECPVCMEFYNAKSKPPKTLFCGHSVCLPCIRSLVRGQHIPCPTCRKLVTRPRNGPHTLPTSFAILSMLESLCEECRRSERSKRCGHCTKTLCNSCIIVHSQLSDVTSEVAALKQTVKEVKDRCDLALQKLETRHKQATSEVQKHSDEIIATVVNKTDKLLQQLDRVYRDEKQQMKSWKQSIQDVCTDVDNTSHLLTTADAADIDDEFTKRMKTFCKNSRTAIMVAKSQEPQQSERRYHRGADVSQQLMGKLDIFKQFIPPTPYESSSGDDHKMIVDESYMPDYGNASYHDWYGGYPIFQGPWDVGTCPATGHIIVSNSEQHRIHILADDLSPVLTFGGLGINDGEYQRPRGVTVDVRGCIYVADRNNHRVQVSDGQGRFLYKFGSYGKRQGQFNTPVGITVDRANNVYVCDSDNYRIQMFTSDGSFIRQYGSQGGSLGQFKTCPLFICVSLSLKQLIVTDGAGNMYGMSKAGCGLWVRPCRERMTEARGVISDGHGHLLVCDRAKECILVLREADRVTVCEIKPSKKRSLDAPRGITRTIDGNLVVCNWDRNNIQKYLVPSM